MPPPCCHSTLRERPSPVSPPTALGLLPRELRPPPSTPARSATDDVSRGGHPDLAAAVPGGFGSGARSHGHGRSGVAAPAIPAAGAGEGPRDRDDTSASGLWPESAPAAAALPAPPARQLGAAAASRPLGLPPPFPGCKPAGASSSSTARRSCPLCSTSTRLTKREQQPASSRHVFAAVGKKVSVAATRKKASSPNATQPPRTSVLPPGHKRGNAPSQMNWTPPWTTPTTCSTKCLQGTNMQMHISIPDRGVLYVETSK